MLKVKLNHLVKAGLLVISWTGFSLGQLDLPYVEFPHPIKPGLAIGKNSTDTITLENNVIKMSWTITNNKLIPIYLEDKLIGNEINLTSSNNFKIRNSNGDEIPGSEFIVTQIPTQVEYFSPPDLNNIKLANRFGGASIEITMRSPKNDMQVIWKAILLDNTNYIRQEYSFKNLLNTEQLISHYYFLDQNSQNPITQGTVAGSPVTDGNFFFGVESPYGFHNIASDNRVLFWIKKTSPLSANETYFKSTVIGIAPSGQMRRSFLYYISLERAHYYRQFTHFNAWYDNSYYTEPWLKKTMETLHFELAEKRGLPVKSYVIDDGWDDPNNPDTWSFNGNLPAGFKNLLSTAEEYSTGFGVWMSPFGGYGGRDARIGASQTYGAETKVDTIDGRELFSLAGPNYYKRFKTAALDLINNHGLNFLKVEMGAWDTYREQWQDDQEATLRLADTLRIVDPEFYFNASSGTYPSPFWLRHIESTWRAWGGDAPNLKTSFTGDHPREHWIGGRDYSTFYSIVKKGPLYPISSLMLHGITIGTGLYPATYPNDLTSISHEVRSFYASGVTCSELYISHSILTSEMYDLIAEAGTWAQKNRDILEDVHWIGGDPSKGEVYGKAAWNKRGGMVYLRNPRNTPQSFSFDIGEVLELPEGSEQTYFLTSPWLEDAGKDSIIAVNGNSLTINLQPLDVIVYDAIPKNPYVSIKKDISNSGKLIINKMSSNPFHHSYSLEFKMEGEENPTALILDVKGKVLKKLNSIQLSENKYKILWNGNNHFNNPVIPGIYYLHLHSGNRKIITKTLMKIN